MSQPTRTTTHPSRAAFVVDPESLSRNSGRQIDWAAISSGDTDYMVDGKKVIKAGTIMSEHGGLLRPRAMAGAVTIAVTSNVATVTQVGHGHEIGDVIHVSGATPDELNGTFTVASVPDDDTFTYAVTATNGAATGSILMGGGATCILATNAVEDDPSDSLSGYGCLIGGVLYENLLPDATGAPAVLPAGAVAELQAAGTRFAFEQYRDTRSA